jgi:hypothetical protein
MTDATTKIQMLPPTASVHPQFHHPPCSFLQINVGDLPVLSYVAAKDINKILVSQVF